MKLLIALLLSLNLSAQTQVSTDQTLKNIRGTTQRLGDLYCAQVRYLNGMIVDKGDSAPETLKVSFAPHLFASLQLCSKGSHFNSPILAENITSLETSMVIHRMIFLLVNSLFKLIESNQQFVNPQYVAGFKTIMTNAFQGRSIEHHLKQLGLKNIQVLNEIDAADLLAGAMIGQVISDTLIK